MGHTSKDTLVKTQRSTKGIPNIKQNEQTLCAGCLKGKQTVTAIPSRSITKTTGVVERVHTDVMKPMRAFSKGGAKYYLTFVDDYKILAISTIKIRSEVAGKFKEFLTLCENR
ncbi:retrovirus-related pol polyprotein from transposon tnt 1-94 [Plasmopara halstedii]|uniref:Retrovirus-related pol polyprotein from transposon tnt 1-94 n=1 Tax=Plasmopara halstedii TaxID=4781 RepID=A0A0P1A625_PLAHL|nr:retrovirus-related pol polyprotein from transposon tnt 1-94 [Plasmopara halstedii]CEG35678.1 retrovirus-related pol polyprotein from transposon tnt 1-94 [Plasmopara halstedii]|eukprot:XP_024572047.1 retrovirus-related pol polyprotein from transposon tnt 1-94 [Plasmopara halstedii]